MVAQVKSDPFHVLKTPLATLAPRSLEPEHHLPLPLPAPATPLLVEPTPVPPTDPPLVLLTEAGLVPITPMLPTGTTPPSPPECDAHVTESPAPPSPVREFSTLPPTLPGAP